MALLFESSRVDLLFESSVPMPKHQVNVSGGEGVDLTKLQSSYDQLSASLEEVTRLAESLDAGSTIDDQMLERRQGEIYDELHTVARTIAAKESRDVSGAGVKARVLLSWCDPGSDDIITQLTVSLCRDVLRLWSGDGNVSPTVAVCNQANPRAGEVDTVVGTRLRLRRRMLDMSQQELADALHIAQQELQRYETGQNRVSASLLYEAARILNAPVAWFYEDLADPVVEESLQALVGMEESEASARTQSEIEGLLRAYASGPDKRKKLLQLLKVLVSSRGY
jgi:transcriptional regulator with XRE-family HTH domain